MNNMKRLAIYSTMFTLSIASLVGCSFKNKDKNKGVIEYGNFNELSEDIKEGDKKEFSPYEHFFSVHLETLDDVKKYLCNQSLIASSSAVPEEYEMFIIQVQEQNEQQYDIWFINMASVEVTASYNEETATYDYNHFGNANAVEKMRNNTSYVLQNIK